MNGPDPAPRLRGTAGGVIRPTVRTIVALIVREMAVSYGRSPGGYIWMVLEPVLGTALLTAIFALALRAPPLGTNFAIFYASGLLPFTMYLTISNKVAQSVNYSKALLNYPRVTFVDAILARLILTVLTQLMVICLVFGGIMLFYDTRTVLELDRVLLSVSMASVLGLGVGVMNCFLITMFPIFQQVWGILMRPLFFLSGVLLLYDDLPKAAQDVLWYNPLMHVTGEMRAALYPEYVGDYVSPGFVFLTSMLLILIGLIFLRRYHRDMLEN